MLPAPVNYVFLNCLRLLRGWRWRAILAISLFGAYWFGRGPGFGRGAMVWFPGAESGITAFLVFFAAAGLILGVDAFGQWERQRSANLLQPRLVRPFLFALTNLSAILITLLPVVFIASFWSAIGAWRAGLIVLWTPNLLFCLALTAPLCFAAACCGFTARALIPSDLGALFFAATCLAPALFFRLSTAPPAEVFQAASLSLGVLIPLRLILSEALVTAGYGLIFLGLFPLIQPSPRAGSSPQRRLPRVLRAPNAGRLVKKLLLQLRIALGPAIVPSFAAIAAGALTLQWMSHHVAYGPENPLEKAQPTVAALQSPIPAARITSRIIDLSGGKDSPITVNLSIDTSSTTHSLAAVTFGPAFRWRVLEDSELQPAAIFPGDSSLAAVDLSGKEGVQELRVSLTPRPVFQREWAKSWHSRYHRFDNLSHWYGETAAINFLDREVTVPHQPAPYQVQVPAAEGIEWHSGSAAIEKRGDSAAIVQSIPDYPNRLIASNLIELRAPNEDFFDLRFIVQPARKDLVTGFFIIFKDPLVRMRRLFGDPRQPIVLYESPQRNPADPMALSSNLLDALEAMLPEIGSYDYTTSTREEILNLFPRIHEGIVREIINQSFSDIRPRFLLSDGFALYLHRTALGEGKYTNLAERTGRDLVLVPWQLEQRGMEDVMRVERRQASQWKEPLLPRSGSGPPPPSARIQAFHHMLRTLLGEDAYRRTISLLMDRAGSPLTIDGLQDAAEQAYQKELDWFFRQWLTEGVLPRFRVVSGQAFLVENPETRNLEYRIEVTVRNDGTGRMPVPWVLVTEGEEDLSGTVWLGSGEEKSLTIISPDRPTTFALDSSRTIAAEKARPEKSDRILFKTIREI